MAAKLSPPPRQQAHHYVIHLRMSHLKTLGFVFLPGLPSEDLKVPCIFSGTGCSYAHLRGGETEPNC